MRVAVVSGGIGGLGTEICRSLARAGRQVVAADLGHRPERIEAFQAELAEFNGQVVFEPLDVADPASCEALAQRVQERFGGVDILVNAAGINNREPADSVSAGGWDRTLELNLSAPFFLAQKLVPAMRQKGWGRIVNFASLQTFRAFPGGIAYGASKGGIAQLTRAMAEAWSQHGINCNAIGPGFFRTELTAPVFDDPELERANAAKTCIGRNGEPSDIDGPMLFLCSPASDYVTGQVLMVDGGFTAK